MRKVPNEKKTVNCRAGIPMPAVAPHANVQAAGTGVPALEKGIRIPAAESRASGLRDRKHLRRLDRIFPHIAGPLFFVTCCVRGRRPVLAQAAVEQILASAWAVAPEVYGWVVGRYVVMPDHVHLFTAPCRDDAETLSDFVGRWKRWTAREIRDLVAPGFRWQKEFFDHLLRSSESYGAKWEYVRNNPVRAGLAKVPEEWPFQGELTVFQW